ncbi:MAG: hypothetical protein ACFB4J_07785 [Elainellaceae cyanobacterium]
MGSLLIHGGLLFVGLSARAPRSTTSAADAPVSIQLVDPLPPTSPPAAARPASSNNPDAGLGESTTQQPKSSRDPLPQSAGVPLTADAAEGAPAPGLSTEPAATEPAATEPVASESAPQTAPDATVNSNSVAGSTQDSGLPEVTPDYILSPPPSETLPAKAESPENDSPEDSPTADPAIAESDPLANEASSDLPSVTSNRRTAPAAYRADLAVASEPVAPDSMAPNPPAADSAQSYQPPYPLENPRTFEADPQTSVCIPDPESVRRLGDTVSLQVTVDSLGQVVPIALVDPDRLSAEGEPILIPVEAGQSYEALAICVLQEWDFEPAIADGVPVPSSPLIVSVQISALES